MVLVCDMESTATIQCNGGKGADAAARVQRPATPVGWIGTGGDTGRVVHVLRVHLEICDMKPTIRSPNQSVLLPRRRPTVRQGQGPGVFCDDEYAYLQMILPSSEPAPDVERPGCF